MTSEEIKLALENPPEGKYLNLESVLCEIAYQLAVHNEREVEAMPSQGPGKRTLRAKLAWWIAGPALRLIRQEVTELAKANQQLEGRIAVLEAMLGRNLSTVEFRQC